MVKLMWVITSDYWGYNQIRSIQMKCTYISSLTIIIHTRKMVKVQKFCHKIVVFLPLPLLFFAFNTSLCLRIVSFQSAHLYCCWQKRSIEQTTGCHQWIYPPLFALHLSPNYKKRLKIVVKFSNLFVFIVMLVQLNNNRPTSDRAEILVQIRLKNLVKLVCRTLKTKDVYLVKNQALSYRVSTMLGNKAFCVVS